MCTTVPWLSWLKRLPSKQEITSSNLVGTLFYSCPEVDWVIMTISQFRGVYLLLLFLGVCGGWVVVGCLVFVCVCVRGVSVVDLCFWVV